MAAALALAKLDRFAHVSALAEREACGRLACSVAFIALTGLTVAQRQTRALLASHRVDTRDGLFQGVDARPTGNASLPASRIAVAMQISAENSLRSRCR